MKKIIITGGHLSPALAMILKMRKNNEYKLFFFGRKYSFEGDGSYSLEYKTVKELGIDFHNINTGRLQRILSVYSAFSLLKVPYGFFQTLILIKKIRPDLVLSFGGYVALTVCLAAKISGIKIITHEQTRILGFANRIISLFAEKLCLSFENTAKVPKSAKTSFTGNPLIQNKNKVISTIRFGDKRLPLLYITGGSGGSVSVNNAVKDIIEILVKKFRVLHQTGSAMNSKSYKDAQKIKNSMHPHLRANYEIVEHINPLHIQQVYRKCKIVIGRAGANTVSEIVQYSLPSVLIPLPWSADHEQDDNARLLENVGAAIVIKQEDLESGVLLEKIMTIFSGYENYRKNCLKARALLKKNPAEKILKLIENALQNS